MEIVTSTNIFCERNDGSRIPMETSIRACAAAGYRALDFGFVELSLSSKFFHSEDWMSELGEYKALAEELGLRFVQAHATIWDFCNPGPEDETRRRLFLRSLQGAHFLGVPWIVAHPSTGVTEGMQAPDTHEQNVRFFREMADYAADLGLGIAIENMWGKTREGVPRYAIQAEELLRLVEEVDRENVGACWDVEHGSVEKLDQGAAIRLLGKHLKGTHISDETGPNNIHILPYTGFVDWDTVLKSLAVIDYTGIFAFEIQHYLPGMPMELVPAAMELSVQVGAQMIEKLEQYKRALRC